MKVDKDVFVSCIIRDVAKACEEIGIKQGAIGIAIDPAMIYYSEWAGVASLANFDINIASIDGAGDTVCYGDRAGCIVGDAAGVVCMKIASTRLLMRYYQDNGINVTDPQQMTSGALPNELAGNGLTQWKGCVAIPIGHLPSGIFSYGSEPAMTIYIAVSGGTQDQDEKAAWAGLKVIRDFVSKEDNLMLHRALVIDEK